VTPVVRFLVILNVAMFIVQIQVPEVYSAFVFVPVLTLFRPWTIVSYMFLHGGMMHLLLNMLGLFFFGSRVEDRLGGGRFTVLYFLSGISGALLSLVFTPTAQIIGASAGVFGVMLAFAHFWPDMPIYIWGIMPIPARILIIITTIGSVASGFSGRDGIAHFAHLGGFAGAWLYMRWLERKKGEFKRKANKATAAVTNRLEAWRTIDLSKVHQVNRDEVGRLLEKVRTHGLGSLNGQERIFLSGFVPPDESAKTSPTT
jgi:membrane associated rhomboid family serine protease